MASPPPPMPQPMPTPRSGVPGAPPVPGMAGPGGPPPMKMPVPQPMGKPMPPGAPGAPPVAGAPVMPGQPGAPGMPPEGELAPVAGFWQQPWVQNVLPFITSLVTHAAIIVLGVTAVKVVVEKGGKALQQEEQTIIPEATLAENGPPGGVPNVGPNNDPFRQAMQDVVPDAGTPEGWASKEGPAIKMESSGGGSGDEEGSNIIGIGAGQLGGIGKGRPGGGKGDGTGSGSGDGSGPLAQFGAPGGGAIGPKGPVFGNGGNARKIVFICDATGTMINKFALLRAELTKAISGLKPVQSFNVVFFFDGPKAASVDNASQLLVATPDNKRKAYKFMEDFSTTGQTDPLPAIKLAFQMQPQLIYFLSDGEFNNLVPYETVVAEIDKLNKDRKTKINTIIFGKYDKQAEEVLQKIASDHGGTYRFVSEEDLTAGQ